MQKLSVHLCFVIAMFLSVCSIYAGPFPDHISKWDDAEKARQRKAGDKLLAELSEAIKARKKNFNIPAGNYRFNKTVAEGKRACHIRLEDINDMVVEGNGANFFFETTAVGINILRSNNLTIKNLFIDWDPVPFSQGRVTSLDEKQDSFAFKPDPGYEKICESMFKVQKIRGMLFDPVTRRMTRQSGFGLQFKKKLKDGSYYVKVKGFYRNSAAVCGFKPGILIALWCRTGRAIRTEICSKITLEDITLYSSPFVCFNERLGAGGNVYRRCRIVKRPGTDRLIGGNADGFNIANMLKGPVIESCEIDTIGDDFVNIHGSYFRIFEKKSPTVLIVQPLYLNGMKNIELSFLENQTWRALGKRICLSAKNITYKIPKDDKAITKRKWAANKNFKPGSRVSAMEVSLNKPVDFGDDAIFSINSCNSVGAVIRNCKFSGSLARGFRMMTKDILIIDNKLSLTVGTMLTTAGQPGFWGESVTSRNMVVRNNDFIEGCFDSSLKHKAVLTVSSPGDLKTADLAGNIVIENNRIIRPGAAAIELNVCEDVTFSNNTISQLGYLPPVKPDYKVPAIIMGQTRNVVIKGNKIVDPGKYASSKDIEKE